MRILLLIIASLSVGCATEGYYREPVNWAPMQNFVDQYTEQGAYARPQNTRQKCKVRQTWGDEYTVTCE